MAHVSMNKAKEKRIPPDYSGGILSVNANTFLTVCRVRIWDTSNRAINVIINNLKGIFFDDDDFEHMSCSIEACWGKIGITEVRICDHKSMKKCDIFK